VVEPGDDHLVAGHPAGRQGPEEGERQRRHVLAEGDLGRVGGGQQLVGLPAGGERAAGVGVGVQQVSGHGVGDPPGDLAAVRPVEEHGGPAVHLSGEAGELRAARFHVEHVAPLPLTLAA
jgi:hypothetical protein